MSKLSQLHAELSEQAAELGFESIGEAEQAGYGVDWENAKLILVEDQQEQAHQAWLKERDSLLNKLYICASACEKDGHGARAQAVYEAIDFIKRGEV